MKWLSPVNTLLLVVLVGWMGLASLSDRDATITPEKSEKASLEELMVLAGKSIDGDEVARAYALLGASAEVATDADDWRGLVKLAKRFNATDSTTAEQRAQLQSRLRNQLISCIAASQATSQISELASIATDLTMADPPPVGATTATFAGLGERRAGEAEPTLVFTALAPDNQDGVVGMLRMGLEERNDEKSNVLIGAALGNTDVSIAECCAMWSLIEKYMESLADESERTAVAINFLGFVDGRILDCKSLDEFNDLWELRATIADARARYGEAWQRKCIQNIRDAIAGFDTMGIAELVADESFQIACEDLEASLGLGLQLTPEAKSEFFAARKSLMTGIAATLDEMKIRLADREREALAGEGISPQDEGVCSETLTRLAEVAEALGAAEIIFLLSAVQGEKMNSSPLDELNERIGGLARSALGLQTHIYNLWALKQIDVGGRSPTWHPYFAQIETGLLNPTVAALFSMERDRLLHENRENATILQRRIAGMLSSNKISLTAF